MNFYYIYNHYVSIERVIEVEPETPLIIRSCGVDKVFEEPKVSPSTTPTEKSPWIIDGPMIRKKPSLYLTLELLEDHISYQGTQKSTVRMADDGLLEGRYVADREITFSRQAFTAVVLKTFSLWKDAYTFYMVNVNSRGFKKFRNLVVISEERLAPITLKLNDIFQEYYANKFSFKKKPDRIIIPLVSFSRPAFHFLIEEGILTIPERYEDRESEVQNLIDEVLSKFSMKWWI